ncbi:VOC family protein [soil metagenome]
MNRPFHFEFHSTDTAATNRFFSDVFGWSMAAFPGGSGYWMATTGAAEPGIDGGIMPSRDGQQRTVNTIEVDSVDRVAEVVKAAGGKICVEKMAIPGIGYLMYATDPTGVLFGFMHEDKAAH